MIIIRICYFLWLPHRPQKSHKQLIRSKLVFAEAFGRALFRTLADVCTVVDSTRSRDRKERTETETQSYLQLSIQRTSTMVLRFFPLSALTTLIVVVSQTTDGFVPISTTNRHPRTFLNCICIDCKWVTSCEAYHFVETKHEQPHMTETPTFEPRNGSPTIHVNVRTHRDDKVLQKMWNEHSGQTQQAEAATVDRDDQKDELHGSTVYDLAPITTYEYDVVACEDFIQDKVRSGNSFPKLVHIESPHFS